MEVLVSLFAWFALVVTVLLVLTIPVRIIIEKTQKEWMQSEGGRKLNLGHKIVFGIGVLIVFIAGLLRLFV